MSDPGPKILEKNKNIKSLSPEKPRKLKFTRGVGLYLKSVLVFYDDPHLEEGVQKIIIANLNQIIMYFFFFLNYELKF